MSRQRRARAGSNGQGRGSRDRADSAELAAKDEATSGQSLELRLSGGSAAERASAGIDDTSNTDPGGEPLVAYLHLRHGTTPHTRAVLEGHIESFAEREGYDLRRLLTGSEADDDLLTLRSLMEHVEATGAVRVLVVGPAREALVALHRMAGVQVLTLAQVRPAKGPPTRGRPQ